MPDSGEIGNRRGGGCGLGGETRRDDEEQTRREDNSKCGLHDGPPKDAYEVLRSGAIVPPPAAGVKTSVMRWDDLAYFFEYTIRPSLRTVFVFSIS